jgi:hypothetical protein
MRCLQSLVNFIPVTISVRQTGSQAGRQAAKQGDRQAGRQTHRETRQTDIVNHDWRVFNNLEGFIIENVLAVRGSRRMRV